MCPLCSESGEPLPCFAVPARRPRCAVHGAAGAYRHVLCRHRASTTQSCPRQPLCRCRGHTSSGSPVNIVSHDNENRSIFPEILSAGKGPTSLFPRSQWREAGEINEDPPPGGSSPFGGDAQFLREVREKSPGYGLRWPPNPGKREVSAP